MTDLAARLEQAFEARAQLTPKNVDDELRADVDEAIAMLDSGEARVAEKIDGQWVVHRMAQKSRFAVLFASTTARSWKGLSRVISTKCRRNSPTTARSSSAAGTSAPYRRRWPGGAASSAPAWC